MQPDTSVVSDSIESNAESEEDLPLQWESSGTLCLALYPKELVLFRNEENLTLVTGAVQQLQPHYDRICQGLKATKAAKQDLSLCPVEAVGLSLILSKDRVIVSSPYGFLDVTPVNAKSQHKRGMYFDLKTGFELVQADCVDNTHRAVAVTLQVI